MSVYFSKYCENGHPDSAVTGVDPHMRDRLLSAIRELSDLGPGQPLPYLIPRIKKTHSKPRSVDGSRPRKWTDHHRSHHRGHRSLPGSPSISRSFARKEPTPEGVLKERLRRSLSSKLAEQGNIKVYSSVLHPDVEFKTLSITSETTSKELVSSILEKNNANDKDPNLYYVAMETGIKHKDSGLPISKMIVLDEEARPLELQACQPEGETKFHLKIKSGGLVRIRTNILCPQSSYKTVYIARNTTARQLIRLIINSSETDEKPEDFILREASADFTVDRILQDREYPLEIQTKWKPNEGRLFFLTRLNTKSEKSPLHSLPRTSEELQSEIAKQNHTIDTLNKTIHRLLMEHNHDVSATSSITSHDDRNDYDDIDDYDPISSDPVDQEGVIDVQEDAKRLERARQRKRSIDALDLHNVLLEEEIANSSPRCPSTQMSKLRRSFDRFHRKSSEEMEICDKGIQSDVIINRRHSQIERFRHKFLQFYNEKSVERKASSSLVKKPVTRSWSTSDTEYYALASRYPCLQELETNLSRTSSMNSTCDKEIMHLLEKPTQHHHSTSNWTLHDIINNMDILAVTLTRQPGAELGLELAHVTQTGSPVDQPSDVMYVYHNRQGNTAIVDSPVIASGAMSPDMDYVNGVDDIFNDTSDHNHNHSPNGLISSTGLQDGSSDAESSSTVSDERVSPTGLYGVLDGEGLKPSHGVRIVAIAKGSIVEKAGKLRKDDVILEVNGVNVLNANLDVVIETLSNQGTVNIVVAREKESSSHVEMTETLPNYTPSIPDNENTQSLAEQVQQLTAKVAEMQEILTKKDKTISHLKKSLIKRKLKMTSKEKITEDVQVIV